MGDLAKRLGTADGVLAAVARLKPQAWWRNVLIGAACAAVMLFVRWAASGLYGPITGFIILLPGVIVAALAGGRIGGLTATVVSLLGGWAVAGPNAVGVGVSDRMGQIATVNFLLVGLFCTLMAASLRKTVARLGATDASLSATAAELQAMVDQAAAGIVRSDLTGRIATANARFCAMLGRPASEIEGRMAIDFTHPDDVQETVDFVETTRQTHEERRLEKRYLRPDGSVAWALLSVRTLHDGEGRPYGFMTVAVEITEQKLIEAQLRESEGRFRLMADTAPSPVWMTNPEAEVEFVNQALVDFYGQAAGDILGNVWKQAVHPDDTGIVAEAMAEARPARRPYGFEVRFQRADGAWRWMRVSVNPRFDGQGVFLGYVGMSFDVTDTREALDRAASDRQRQTFLLGLSDRLRDLVAPEEIIAEISRATGPQIGVDRLGYGEVDATLQDISIRNVWTRDGQADLTGVWTMDDFGKDLVSGLKRGEAVRVANVADDPLTADVATAFAGIGAAAVLGAPVLRSGRMRAFLFAHSQTPRVWTDEDATLMEDVAARAFAEIERARAEAEVRESEARFRAVADTAPVLIWVTNRDRVRAFVNQAYVAYNGGTYEDARLAEWREVLHPDDQQRIVAESLAGEATRLPFSMEGRYLRQDGVYRWLKSFSRPRLDADGEVAGFVGVAFDVTDIREAQARLEESESRFRTVADSAPALIWQSDEQARIVFANRRYKTFFGVETDDMLADGWRRIIDPDDVDAFYEEFVRAFGRRDRFERMVRVIHPAMGERWLRCEGAPRFDGEGRFQGYVGANIDVTEAKKAEDDLKRINELLEERVGAALAEKAKAEADLMHAQRMEAVGRLTGGVAHDFNNLLTVVIGALDLMLKAPDDLARQKKLGEAALAAARRGEGLTHQLLAFSRRQALRPEAIDLNALIRQSEPLLRRAADEAVEFKVKLRRGGARVKVDAAQFEAALLNLVVNARDAVAGKGRIVIETQACEVGVGEVRELPAGDYVCVIVSDNGAGMTPEVLDRVFEPFFTTKAVGKGTGLGLSQVYGFARQSGGGVRVSSSPGGGTDVHLYLPPFAEAVSVQDGSTSSAKTAGLAGRRLLLVEDDAGVAAIALEILVGLGLEVHVADTAHRALDALNAAPFDLMLSDVVMPGGMTGVELARVCAQTWPEMRVVLTSGYAGDDVDEALSNAPWPFLRKPYSAEQLAEVLGD